MSLLKNDLLNDLVPSEFFLSQNYPNPFSERTSIKFCMAYYGKVKLQIFNSEGEMIKTLLHEEKKAGTYEVEFSALGLPEGIYTYQLRVGDFLSKKNMILINSSGGK
jgi:hypothetical protein